MKPRIPHSGPRGSLQNRRPVFGARKDCKGKQSFSILQIFFKNFASSREKIPSSFCVRLPYCKPPYCVRTSFFSNADAKVATFSEPANFLETFFEKFLFSLRNGPIPIYIIGFLGAFAPPAASGGGGYSISRRLSRAWVMVSSSTYSSSSPKPMPRAIAVTRTSG